MTSSVQSTSSRPPTTTGRRAGFTCTQHQHTNNTLRNLLNKDRLGHHSTDHLQDREKEKEECPPCKCLLLLLHVAWTNATEDWGTSSMATWRSWGGQPPSWGQQASPSSVRWRRRRRLLLMHNNKKQISQSWRWTEQGTDFQLSLAIKLHSRIPIQGYILPSCLCQSFWIFFKRINGLQFPCPTLLCQQMFSMNCFFAGERGASERRKRVGIFIMKIRRVRASFMHGFNLLYLVYTLYTFNTFTIPITEPGIANEKKRGLF